MEEEYEFVESCAIIALAGVIARASLFDAPEVIAERAFDIGEAMEVERKKRQNVSTDSTNA